MVKKYLDNHQFTNGDFGTIQAHRSIWWNLKHKGKPLALIQGCSAKGWASKGIRHFSDILKDGKLKGWNDLNVAYNLPPSNWRTYTILREACKLLNFPMKLKDGFDQFKRRNGSNIKKKRLKNYIIC